MSGRRDALSARGDGDVPENLHALVFTDRQGFEFPPSRRHFKAIVNAEVMVDR